MKKIVLTAILLATASITFAQFNFGIRGGLNLSDYSNLNNSSKKTDYYVGAILSIKLGNFYTLQPEFTYSKQGTKLNGTQPYLASNTIGVNYFSVDVANKFAIANNVHFIIGPYFDIVMDKDIKEIRDVNDYYYYRYETTGVDLGFTFGLGFDITNNLTIEARYKQGFIGVIDTLENYNADGSYYYYNEDPHLNKVFQLGITYKFELMKSKKK